MFVNPRNIAIYDKFLRMDFNYIYKTQISEIQYITFPLGALLVCFKNRHQYMD